MAENDSRFAAVRIIYDKTPLKWLLNTSTFIGKVVIALIITYFFQPGELPSESKFVLFLLILPVGLWITEVIPPFAVDIFIIAYMVFVFGTDYFFTSQYPIDRYVGTWTSSVIWLLLGGFFLAEGMKVVKLDVYLFRFTIKHFGASSQGLLKGFMLITGFASMVMSNTATTTMMIASIVPLVKTLGKDKALSKALLVGIPAAAFIGGIFTIIGSTPNAIAVGALEGIGIKVSFLKWMAFGFPLALLLIWLLWKFLIYKLKLSNEKIDTTFIQKEMADVNMTQRKIVVFTTLFTVLLWITEPIHKIPLAGTSAFPIVVLTLTRVISSTDVRALPWDTLMLVAGGLSLGLALVDFKLTTTFMDMLLGNNLPLLVLLGLLVLFSVMFSNIMSNTAASSILIPLGLSLGGFYQVSAPILIGICASFALFLPVSTPPNAIAYATNLMEQKDFRLGGLFIGIVGLVITIIWVLLLSMFLF